MTVVNLNLVLNSNQFYTGLDEICHRSMTAVRMSI